MTGTETRGVVLQDRDWRLLRELGTMRLIDREQAKLVAGFRSTTRANYRLLALTRAGLLRRYFTGTIAGGRKAIYTLSRNGAALVAAPFRILQRATDGTLAGDAFLEHQTQINSVFLTLKYQPLPFPGVQLRHWQISYEPISPSVPLTPDAYFELGTPAGIRAVFLEIDLATEALRMWAAKTRYYLQLATSGEFLRIFGRDRFRVLVIVPSEARLRTVRGIIAQATEKIFWLATIEAINRDGFWAPIWLRPTGDQKQPLL